MLEKSAFKILNIIASMAVEGENLVIDKREILSLLDGEITADNLDKHMEALEVNDMITILFSDANLYCLALRPKGKLVSEKNRQAEIAAEVTESEGATVDINDYVAPEAGQKEIVGLKKFILICAGSSFAGGFLAAIIAFLIARFC